MAKYIIETRDWKGSYSERMPKGWKLFGSEDEIETGGDCFAQIFYKGKPKAKKTPQEIYDIYESLLCNSGKIEGHEYHYDKKDGEYIFEL